MSKAFISGIFGQDGAWLSKLLLDRGYEVYGGARNLNSSEKWRLQYLGIQDKIKYVHFDLLDHHSIETAILETKPNEFYNLAAQSSVLESFSNPLFTANSVAISVTKILQTIQKHSPNTKFFQASSAEIFGSYSGETVNEETCLEPNNPYGISKAYAHWMVKNYRNTSNIFAVNGILFSHESELRGDSFFSKKVTKNIAHWKKGQGNILEVGNIENYRDFGFANEYVEGIFLSLQCETSEDYIFSTGKKIFMRDFIEHSFDYISRPIVWDGQFENLKAYDSKTNELLVKINPDFFRPSELSSFIGNNAKAKSKLGWEPKIDYKQIAEIMIDFELNKI